MRVWDLNYVLPSQFSIETNEEKERVLIFIRETIEDLLLEQKCDEVRIDVQFEGRTLSKGEAGWVSINKGYAREASDELHR